MRSVNVKALNVVLAAAGVNLGVLASVGSAATVLSDNFDSTTAGSVNVPFGWKDVVNYTTTDTANTDRRIRGAVITASNAGAPYVDHTSGSGRFATFPGSATLNGPSGTMFDRFMISPMLQLNGSAATLSFYAFSDSSNGKISVLLSTNGGNNIPNYGAVWEGTTTATPTSTFSSDGTYDNGKTPLTGVAVGDFTTTLLSSFNPPEYFTNPARWTQYTVNIPAGLTTAYIAFRHTGTNGTGANFPGAVSIDDVSVTTVPEPAMLGLAIGGLAAGLRRNRRYLR